jgi:hypothetical protein
MKGLSMMLLITVLPFSVAAQTSTRGANGGPVVVMEGHPIEFVAKGQEIIFYILEDDAKSPTLTAGATARAVIQDGGKITAVELFPAEPNMFVGKLEAPLSSNARVVFSAKVVGHNLQARFTNN